MFSIWIWDQKKRYVFLQYVWFIDSKQCVYRVTLHCLQLLLQLKSTAWHSLLPSSWKGVYRVATIWKLKESAKLAVAATTTGCSKTIKQRYLGSLSKQPAFLFNNFGFLKAAAIFSCFPWVSLEFTLTFCGFLSPRGLQQRKLHANMRR